ncbi:hypothetical protein [Mesorhizobium sp. STM 4661]|uniref:hypothetical protein n=1 Tax=Mesorhizobium sp. STM 4661 TaxID=1297570 RepID=UPI0002BFBF88|nr:hypothetical protein [Mesorhizobium sp. STM 4661]CCV16220.1 hypothetical protein MESS4_830440 [Mesorhizobium sp. STM 4661]
MAGEKVHLTKEKETLLITVYGKALESRLPNSLLKDHFADEAVRRIDYDFSGLKVDDNLDVSLAIRAKTLDDWTSAFLAKNPNAIVLHLGCGSIRGYSASIRHKTWSGSTSPTPR